MEEIDKVEIVKENLEASVVAGQASNHLHGIIRKLLNKDKPFAYKDEFDRAINNIKNNAPTDKVFARIQQSLYENYSEKNKKSILSTLNNAFNKNKKLKNVQNFLSSNNVRKQIVYIQKGVKVLHGVNIDRIGDNEEVSYFLSILHDVCVGYTINKKPSLDNLLVISFYSQRLFRRNQYVRNAKARTFLETEYNFNNGKSVASIEHTPPAKTFKKQKMVTRTIGKLLNKAKKNQFEELKSKVSPVKQSTSKPIESKSFIADNESNILEQSEDNATYSIVNNGTFEYENETISQDESTILNEIINDADQENVTNFTVTAKSYSDISFVAQTNNDKQTVSDNVDHMPKHEPQEFVFEHKNNEETAIQSDKLDANFALDQSGINNESTIINDGSIAETNAVPDDETVFTTNSKKTTETTFEIEPNDEFDVIFDENEEMVLSFKNNELLNTEFINPNTHTVGTDLSEFEANDNLSIVTTNQDGDINTRSGFSNLELSVIEEVIKKNLSTAHSGLKNQINGDTVLVKTQSDEPLEIDDSTSALTNTNEQEDQGSLSEDEMEFVTDSIETYPSNSEVNLMILENQALEAAAKDDQIFNYKNFSNAFTSQKQEKDNTQSSNSDSKTTH